MNKVHQNFYTIDLYETFYLIYERFISSIQSLIQTISSIAGAIFDEIDEYFYNGQALLPLRVVQIHPKDFPTTLKTVEVWKRFAKKQNLASCRQLCVCIDEQMQKRFPSFNEAYACVDQRGNKQGILLLSLDQTIHSKNPEHQGRFVKIDYLVTRPQKEHEKVKGVGSMLVHFAQKRGAECHKDGVLLESVPSAENFYKKLGFERIQVEPKDTYCQPMLKLERVASK